MPLYHPFHFEAKIGPFCEKIIGEDRKLLVQKLEISGSVSYNDGEVITLMEEMVSTRAVLSFFRKLEEMMNQSEGKEREYFEIIIRMRREFNLGYRKDGTYLLPKKIKNGHLMLSRLHLGQ